MPLCSRTEIWWPWSCLEGGSGLTISDAPSRTGEDLSRANSEDLSRGYGEDLSRANNLIAELEQVMAEPRATKADLFCGVDLGTAYLVITVVDAEGRPVAGNMTYANVVKDGLVVDYIGAVDWVRRLKAALEERLGRSLERCAVSYPPGVNPADVRSHRYVGEAAGFEVTDLVDEPTAANAVLGIKNGAVVDIGGGTTGIAVLQNGKVVCTADEPTGGTHFSLVLAGAYRVPFEEAETLKKEFSRHKEVLPVVTPVIQKVASIIKTHLQRCPAESLYLVGGTCCLPGLAGIIQREVGIPTFQPQNPLLVTPLGIALQCR